MKITVEADSLIELRTILEQMTGGRDAGSVDELPLGMVVRQSLKEAGVETLDKLSRTTDTDLLSLPNVGRKSVDEIRKYVPFRFRIL